MSGRILVIQGHPDCHARHLCHMLAQAYGDAARGAGHEVETIEPARIDFPLLRSADDWQHGQVPAQLAVGQGTIATFRTPSRWLAKSS
jgi:putative NADPH-quinone reductase